jgi:hypothetical protein
MQTCPKCSSGNIRRSRCRTLWETWRKSITGKHVFRCRACAWRGWGVDIGPDTRDSADRPGARASGATLQRAARAHAEPDQTVDLTSLDISLPLIDAGSKREST